MITERSIILILGILMTLLGFTGIVRRESGAISAEEKHTGLGRAFAFSLGIIWLITGLFYLIGGAVDERRRYDVIGYTSLVSMFAFLIVLSGALLLFMIYSLRHPERHMDEPSITLPPPGHYHFRHLQPVNHPLLGQGVVINSYFQEGHEMVAVLFRDETLTLPADQLANHLTQA